MLVSVDLEMVAVNCGMPSCDAPEETDAAYLELVDVFEKMARVLLERVDEVIEEAFWDEGVVRDEAWKQEAYFLVRELQRYPWLLANVSCPPRYEMVRLLYREWALCCQELRACLQSLAGNDGRRSVRMRVAYADEELAAVNAHTVARRICFETLNGASWAAAR